MSRRAMFRYSVPVDGEVHKLHLDARLSYDSGVRVENGRPQGVMDVLEFWVLHQDDVEGVDVLFQAFGTGHRLPEGARYVGTAPRTPEGMIWHLFDVTEVE